MQVLGGSCPLALPQNPLCSRHSNPLLPRLKHLPLKLLRLKLLPLKLLRLKLLRLKLLLLKLLRLKLLRLKLLRLKLLRLKHLRLRLLRQTRPRKLQQQSCVHFNWDPTNRHSTFLARLLFVGLVLCLTPKVCRRSRCRRLVPTLHFRSPQ